MQPALHGAQGDVQLLGNIRLGKFLPEVEVEDLTVPLAQGLKGFLYSIGGRNAVAAVREHISLQISHGDLCLGGFLPEIVVAFIPGNADEPCFAGVFVL